MGVVCKKKKKIPPGTTVVRSPTYYIGLFNSAHNRKDTIPYGSGSWGWLGAWMGEYECSLGPPLDNSW